MLLGCLVLAITSTVKADDFNKVASTAAQFLKIETGARSLAMAGAYGAIANDPLALYWNVAGISQIRSLQANFTHNTWIADLSHDFAGVVIPAGTLGNIGFSVIALNSQEFAQTTIDQPRGTGIMVDAYDIAVGLSYARYMTDFVSVGITGKYIQQKLWEVSATGMALDVGFLLHTGYKGMTIGLNLNNFGPEMSLNGRNLIRALDIWPAGQADPAVETVLNTASWPLPTSYRVSVAMNVLGGQDAVIGSSGPSNIVLGVTALHPSDNPEQYSLGMEYEYDQLIFARFGYKGNTDEQGFAVGGGLRVPLGGSNLVIDYGYADFGVFDYVQQFSITLAL